jgi:hypothetical protein
MLGAVAVSHSAMQRAPEGFNESLYRILTSDAPLADESPPRGTAGFGGAFE